MHADHHAETKYASGIESSLGLDKLCLFFLPIILVDYSQEVSLLFQFVVPIIPVERCHSHSEKTMVVIIYYSITESEI